MPSKPSLDLFGNADEAPKQSPKPASKQANKPANAALSGMAGNVFLGKPRPYEAIRDKDDPLKTWIMH